MIAKIFAISGRIGRRLLRSVARPRAHRTMTTLKGVIHVGANTGQERDEYARLGLKVLWIEPVPWIFEKLKSAIAACPGQRALAYLALDRDDGRVVMHISNNAGLSSSVMDFALHRDVWPSVQFTHDIEVPSRRLDTILESERIDPRDYDGLVLDTQGSELRVLRGATQTLRHVRMVKVEVADFEAYAGCPRPEEIAAFLHAYGLREFSRTSFATHRAGGRYYDINYLRD
jgi:FkbM family methyltransferase